MTTLHCKLQPLREEYQKTVRERGLQILHDCVKCFLAEHPELTGIRWEMDRRDGSRCIDLFVRLADESPVAEDDEAQADMEAWNDDIDNEGYRPFWEYARLVPVATQDAIEQLEAELYANEDILDIIFDGDAIVTVTADKISSNRI